MRGRRADPWRTGQAPWWPRFSRVEREVAVCRGKPPGDHVSHGVESELTACTLWAWKRHIMTTFGMLQLVDALSADGKSIRVVFYLFYDVGFL